MNCYREWRQFHEACPPVVHVAEVTSPGQPDDHVLTILACDSPISRRHVYTSRAHRVVVAIMTSSHKNPLHLFVQFQGQIFIRVISNAKVKLSKRSHLYSPSSRCAIHRDDARETFSEHCEITDTGWCITRYACLLPSFSPGSHFSLHRGHAQAE